MAVQTLTVAEVSGLIAAAVMVVQFALPMALIVILIQYVGTENTAATWSVVSRMISNTIWPLVLRADTVGAASRSFTTVVAIWTMTLSTLLLVITSVVAPLGLREEVVPYVSKPVLFQYVKDTTPWGSVTMPRPDAEMGRYCEFGRNLNCPGQFQGVTMVETDSGLTSVKEDEQASTINTTLPANFTDMFTSATRNPGNTLSGLLDIQHRRFEMSRTDIIDFGRPRVRGDEAFVENLMPSDSIFLREGVIIDMRDPPSVGFRNHTIPAGLEHGGTWSEDLTFLEPVTSCVDTNLTFEMERIDTTDSFSNKETVFFIDRGAWRGLDITDLEAPPWNDNQTLDLPGRALKAARMLNVLTAALLNITLPLDPSIDILPKLNLTGSKFTPSLFVNFLHPEAIGVSEIESPLTPTFSSNLSATGNLVPLPTDFVPAYPNGIRRMFARNYTAVGDICRGYYTVSSSLDLRAVNITNPAVSCGVFVGGSRFEEVSSTSTQSLSIARKHIYVCASAVRAGIKSVEFRYNGTGGRLENLEALRISDKIYPDSMSKPLWAVETSGNRRAMFDPLWGLVSDAYETFEGFFTTRADKLWLPMGADLALNFFQRVGSDALAAVSTPMLVLSNLYQVMTFAQSDYYSGQLSHPLASRWARLSENVTSVAVIPSIMLTDALATLLVGTKTAIRSKPIGWPPKMAVEDPDLALAQANIDVYERVIRYDLRYAIPAIITLFVFAVVGLWAFGILLFSPSVLRTLQRQYNQISTGRLVTNLMYPGRSDPNQSSSEWAAGDGALLLKFGRVKEPMQNYFCQVEAPGYQYSSGEKGDGSLQGGNGR